MNIRADNIGNDLREAVRKHLEGKGKRAQNNFARECQIQPLQLNYWLKGDKGFHQDTLERIGKKLTE